MGSFFTYSFFFFFQSCCDHDKAFDVSLIDMLFTRKTSWYLVNIQYLIYLLINTTNNKITCHSQSN